MMPLGEKFKRYYAICEDSCIYFCKSINNNDFAVCYVVYNCTIDTMMYRIQEWDNKQHNVMKVRHEFDSEYLLIALEEFE